MNEIYFLDLFFIEEPDNWICVCNGAYRSYEDAVNKIDQQLLRDLRINMKQKEHSSKTPKGFVVQVTKEKLNQPLFANTVDVKYYKFDIEDFTVFFHNRYSKDLFGKLSRRILHNLSRRKFLTLNKNFIKDKTRFIYEESLTDDQKNLLIRYQHDQENKTLLKAFDSDYLNLNIKV